MTSKEERDTVSWRAEVILDREPGSKMHKCGAYRSEMGRSSVEIECPFCGEVTTAYVWSLAGSGKRCRCGAMHTGSGVTLPPKKKGAR